MKDAQQQFRDAINLPHIHAKLRRNLEAFLIVCSAMDTIGDADAAFCEFERESAGGDLRYLDLYGVYQAVQLTISSLRDLSYRLQVSLPGEKQIDALAAERGLVAGHPTRQAKDKVIVSTFVSRFSMKRDTFTAQHATADQSKSIIKTYALTDAIKRIRELRDQALSEMAKNHIAADRRQRVSMTSVTLSSCFHSSTEWMLQHLAVAPYETADRNLILTTDIPILDQQIASFIETLDKLDFSSVYPELITNALVTRRILERALALVVEGRTDCDLDLFAYCESAVERVRSLISSANEIDSMLREPSQESA